MKQSAGQSRSLVVIVDDDADVRTALADLLNPSASKPQNQQRLQRHEGRLNVLF